MPDSKSDIENRHAFVRKLAEKVRKDDRDRQVWKDKQVVAYNSRMGLRRRTNRPYPGASEVPIPITDMYIKKIKSIYVSVATQNSKQIAVNLEEGEPVTEATRDSANRIERALNNLVRKRDFQWAKKITLFVDYFLENGHAVFKVIEKFFVKSINKTINMANFTPDQVAQLKAMKQDDLRVIISNRYDLDIEDKDDLKQIDSIIKQFKAGKKLITFTYKTAFSEPTVIPERGLRIIVPSSGTELQRLPRICHDMWLNYQELVDMADEGVYRKDVVDALDPDGSATDDSLTTNSWSISEGVTPYETESGLFNVREVQSWYEGEKWVFTYIERGSQHENKAADTDNDLPILQEMKLPYDHGMWTYVKHDFELKNTRWYNSRGVPEQLRGLHQTIEKMYNARLVRDEYNNAPMWRASKQLGMGGDEIRLRPGQIIEAEQGEIEQINKGVTVDVSSKELEQQAKAYAEQYISISDFTNRSAMSQQGVRTATEINAVQQNTGRQLGIDVALFLETLSEVAVHMYLILKQSVDTPKKIGGVILKPEDFLVKCNVAWVGSIESTDKDLQLQKAAMRLQAMQTVGVPAGIVTPQNMYNALREMFAKDNDVENPDEYVTAPQLIQVNQAEQQQNEILRMMGGFDASVHPTDDDATHLQVLEAFTHDPRNAANLKNPELVARIQKHANLHIQAEAMKNGTQAQGQTAPGGVKSQIARKVAKAS